MKRISKGWMYGIAVVVGLTAAVGYSTVYTFGQKTVLSGSLQSSASGSRVVDTFNVLTQPVDWKSLSAMCKIKASSNTSHGIGLVDSGVMVWKTKFGERWFTVNSTLAGAAASALPCSSYFSVVSPLADTIIKNGLYLIVIAADSTGDSVQSITWPIEYEVIGKDTK